MDDLEQPGKEDYYTFSGLEHVYLEDSYVLNITVKPGTVEFLMEVVLREQHPLYHPPGDAEQYCYAKAILKFSDVRNLEWVERTMRQYSDATGTTDYGNMDALFRLSGWYHIRGDWGYLRLVSSPPVLDVNLGAM